MKTERIIKELETFKDAKKVEEVVKTGNIKTSIETRGRHSTL